MGPEGSFILIAYVIHYMIIWYTNTWLTILACGLKRCEPYYYRSLRWQLVKRLFYSCFSVIAAIELEAHGSGRHVRTVLGARRSGLGGRAHIAALQGRHTRCALAPRDVAFMSGAQSPQKGCLTTGIWANRE